MKPLLWKEIHDLRPWVLSGFALVAAIELLFQTHSFRDSFEGGYVEIFMPFLIAIAAIGLGVAQVAGERHAGTLDFLLVRPVAQRTIVWTKFLAGSIALALLMAVLVGLGFVNPQVTGDTALKAIRELVGFKELALAMFPRYWCLYALTLFFSVMLGRSAKVAAALAVMAIAVVGVAEYFTLDAPFSGFVHWLPYVNTSGGLLLAARSAGLMWLTGLSCCAVAILITAASAALLERSPERYLGNRGLALVAAGMVGAGMLGAVAAKLPEVAPDGSFSFATGNQDASVGVVASGGRVAVINNDTVRFLDFSHPAQPVLLKEVQIPLFTSSEEWSVDKAAMAGDTVYLVGERKAVPADEIEIAMVKADGSIDAIPTGGVAPYEFNSAPIVAGNSLLLAQTANRVYCLLVFDLASKRQVASLVLDTLPPLPGGARQSQPPIEVARRGPYLYLATPGALTTVDISVPSRPVAVSRLEHRPRLTFMADFPRPLAWQGDKLFAIEMWPQSLETYDLTDPGRPRPSGEFIWHAGLSLAGSGTNLYLPWRSGVLEAQAANGSLESRRYLRGINSINAMAVDGDMVYAVTAADKQKRRTVLAFRVGR